MKAIRFSKVKLAQIIDRWPDAVTFANLLGRLMPKDLAKPSKQIVAQWHGGAIPDPKYLPYIKLIGGCAAIDELYEEYEVN